MAAPRLSYRSVRLLQCLTICTVIALCVIGCLFIYSATYSPLRPYSSFVYKQLFGIGTGLLWYALVSSLDLHRLERWSLVLMPCIILLLAVTLVKGTTALGAQRWLKLGPVSFQPSELVKSVYPLFFGACLAVSGWTGKLSTRLGLWLTGVLGVTVLLIIKQPDLTTALIIGSVGSFLIYLAGIPRWLIITTLTLGVVAAPLLWHQLHDYQKRRILVFLGGGNSQRERYQVEQSRIAIGSGQIWGKGLLKGTQNKLRFLPECRTDFIYAVVCEEWGWLGAMLVFILYVILCMCLLTRLSYVHDPTAIIIGYGTLLPLVIGACINMGMVTGVFPVVGIPLLFMSYGITHIWASFVALGILESVFRTDAEQLGH